MASDANVLALQHAINRLSTPGAFPAVATDGVIGSKTAQGTINALTLLTKIPTFSVTATGLITQLAPGGAINQAQVKTSASGLQQYINAAADTQGWRAAAPLVATMPPPTLVPNLPGAQPATIPTLKPMAAGLFGLPTWTTWVGAGGLALLMIMLISGRKKPAGGAPVEGQDIRCLKYKRSGECYEWSWR